MPVAASNDPGVWIETSAITFFEKKKEKIKDIQSVLENSETHENKIVLWKKGILVLMTAGSYY